MDILSPIGYLTSPIGENIPNWGYCMLVWMEKMPDNININLTKGDKPRQGGVGVGKVDDLVVLLKHLLCIFALFRYKLGGIPFIFSPNKQNVKDLDN